jgi:lipopolysaccharide biosynthesis protein
MATLAVLVHYDPHGLIADHVRYTIDALRPAADRLVFVTTADLTPAARARLDTVDEAIARPNTGYDFSSWRTGLLATGDWPDHDRLILANDSIVGPLAPVTDLLAHHTATGADGYGITISHQYLTHLQSYFMAFTPAVLSNPYFHAFWHAMTPIDDRERVIDNYELGLARLLHDTRTTLAATYTPTAQERRLGASRNLRLAARRPALAAAYGMLRPPGPMEHEPSRGAFSPVHVLWDRALTGALPAVKVTHFTKPFRTVPQLRGDLARLTDRYPAAFAGFAEYLARVGGPRL